MNLLAYGVSVMKAECECDLFEINQSVMSFFVFLMSSRFSSKKVFIKYKEGHDRLVYLEKIAHAFRIDSYANEFIYKNLLHFTFYYC